MKSKLVTLTVTMIALMGLSFLVAAQTQRPGAAAGIAAKRPIPRFTYLKCAPYNKEMNQKIFVTNNTADVIKKGTVVKYSINNETANFTLASDLGVNVTITPQSLPYQGQPSCKAWF